MGALGGLREMLRGGSGLAGERTAGEHAMAERSIGSRTGGEASAADREGAGSGNVTGQPPYAPPSGTAVARTPFDNPLPPIGAPGETQG